MNADVRVSCVIPAYNEAATIAGVVGAARACPEVDEVIVVSDGSTDATDLGAARAGADRVLTLPRNTGKSDAVLTALRHARGGVIVLLDADLLGLRPDHLSQLVRPVLDGRIDMAVAHFSDDPWHSLLQPLSGQRALRAGLLCTPHALEGSGFGLEMALDRLAKQRGARVAQVAWGGVRHRSKREKYGTVGGLRLQVRASSDLLRQARPGVRARRIPSTPRRSPTMILAIVLLVLLITASAPIFLTHPSRASAHSLPSIPLPSPADRLLVIVAHPDDEVIGAGGLIAAARRRGASVTVLVVTSGDSNRLSAAVMTRKVRPGAAQLIEEGRVRQQETLAALAALGVGASDVVFFGFPDRALQQVMRSTQPVTSPFTRLDRAIYPGVAAPGAAYTRPVLIALTAKVISRVRPTAIVTHAPFDRHADHSAVAELVDAVRGHTPVYAFLVHAPGFPRPLRLSPRDALAPPSELVHPAQWSWVRFDLPADIEEAKLHAVDAYHSQIVTPYLRLLLPSFVRTNELFAVHER